MPSKNFKYVLSICRTGQKTEKTSHTLHPDTQDEYFLDYISVHNFLTQFNFVSYNYFSVTLSKLIWSKNNWS